MAPYLAMQGCLACESGVLSYDSLVAGLKYLANSPMFTHATASLVLSLCEELVINSKEWESFDWRYCPEFP